MTYYNPKRWSPGSFVVYDNSGLVVAKIHVALGIIISNDGEFISVIWGRGNDKQFCKYRIKNLNPAVINVFKKGSKKC